VAQARNVIGHLDLHRQIPVVGLAPDWEHGSSSSMVDGGRGIAVGKPTN
jgi:hypothetical protein